MIRINLLPIRQLKKRIRLGNEVAAFCLIFVALLIVLASANFMMARKIDGLKQEIASLNSKKNSYRPILMEIDKLKRDKQLLDAKTQAINKLKENSQLTVRVLDEIANRTLTSRMWITSLKQTGNKLSISGIALDNATIAQYMNQLEESLYFDNAELVNSSQTVVAEQKLKSFGLTLTITPPGPQGESN
jgi:type IV pilus assembly protein PilN